MVLGEKKCDGRGKTKTQRRGVATLRMMCCSCAQSDFRWRIGLVKCSMFYMLPFQTRAPCLLLSQSTGLRQARLNRFMVKLVNYFELCDYCLFLGANITDNCHLCISLLVLHQSHSHEQRRNIYLFSRDIVC